MASSTDINNLCQSCGKIAQLTCARCKLFYCNLNCQKIDWSSHRYICAFKNKPHIAARYESKLHENNTRTEKAEDINMVHNSSTPRNGSEVVVAAVIKSNIFYIRSAEFSDNISYFKTLNSIRNERYKCSPLDRMPCIGDLVIADMDAESKQSCRALVLKPDTMDCIRVIFLEFGHVEQKKLSQLSSPTSKCYSFPKQAIPFVLKNTELIELTNDTMKALLKYVENQKFKLIISDGSTAEQLEGDLIDVSSGKSLNDFMFALIHSNNIDKRTDFISDDYIQTKLIPSGENVSLKIMDTSIVKETQFISCIHTDEIEGLEKFIQSIQKHSNYNIIPYMPSVNELCIVYNNAKVEWSRCRCIKVIDDHYAKVLFFDYGNRTEKVHKSKIQIYPKEFIYPIVTVDCEIYGLPEDMDEQLAARLTELLTRGPIIANRVVKVEEENYNIVYFNNILTALL